MEVNGWLHAPATLLPGERDPSTHCMGGYVNLNQSGRFWEHSCQKSNHRSSVFQHVARYRLLPTRLQSYLYSGIVVILSAINLSVEHR